MYSREDLNTRVKTIIRNLSRDEELRQREMATSFKTTLYDLVYAQVCYYLKRQKTANGYSRNKAK